VRIVLDTGVIVAALRSPSAASAALLRRVRNGEVIALGSVALALEFEAVCRRPEHQIASGLTRREVNIFADAVIAMMELVTSRYLWRPQLRDTNHEMVLEAAINGHRAFQYKSTASSGCTREVGSMKKDVARVKDNSVYPLRLPRSLKDEVVRLSLQDGTSINQFVSTAVAAKVVAMETAQFFQDRQSRADFKAFDQILKRRGGEPPVPGDELPE
jgi:predicted nucleic acid-binding protein